MKRLVAILMCIALLSTVCLAENVPGMRIVADEITVSVGEETFAPDMSVVLENAMTADGEFLSFCVEYAGEQLLPVQTKLGEGGAFVMLDDSQVYCFAPEWFAGPVGEDESAAVYAISALLDAHVKELPELAFGFVAFLDAQPADEFLLDMPLLIDWLAAELAMDEGALNALADARLPEIRAVRDTTKYTLSVGGEMPMNLYLTHDQRMVSLKCTDMDFGAGMQIYRDGNVQASLQTYPAYVNATDENLVFKLQYEPAEDGSAEFTMSIDYDDTWSYGNWGRLFVYFDCLIGADGARSAQVKFTDQSQLLGVPVGAQLSLHSTAADVVDRMSGKDVQIIQNYTDESMNLLAFAAMGLMGDVEKLASDPVISEIVEAYGALFMEYYGVELFDTFSA